ncbi:zinc finger protein 19-like [Ptychodera flava]|uniref:zinc finger protein 19-like n=1 Tax=Ptychodera flava TaxID=63121 RepID=UPI00396A394D
MSKVLKAEEIKQMKSSLFQQGYKLVSEAGCNVFIKVTDCQSSQYYGSIGLLMEYASDSGMTLTPADTLVDGKSGLPVKENIQHNAPPKTPDQFNLASVSESDLTSTAAKPSRHKHTPAQTSELNEAIQKCIAIFDEDHIGETIEVLNEDTFYNNEVDRISNDSDNDNQNIADDESDSECGEINQKNATMKSKQGAIQDNEKPKFGENSLEWSLTFGQRRAHSSTHTDESVSPKKRKEIQTVEETRTILLTKHPNSDLYVYSGRNAHDYVDHSYFKKSSSESNDLEQCDSVTDTDTPLDVSGETQTNHIIGKTQTLNSESFLPQQMNEELEKTCVVIEEPVLMENSLLQPGELNSDSQTLKVRKTNKSVDEKRPFVCQTCNALYGLKKSLVKHVKAEHSESDLFSCQVCGQGFRGFTALLRHKRSQHPESVKFGCRLCPAEFSLQSELRAHKATHKELDHLKCAVCQICLSSRNKLRIHLEREHPDAPPLTDKKNEIPRENHKFYCDLCKRGYMHKMTFKRHIQTHEREKVTFSCSLCDKTYMREDSLRMHMQKVHPGSVKYSCHVCIAKFNTWNELRKHKEIHKVNGRIRFKCHICDKAFYHRTKMLYHVKVKHLGLSLPRSICHVCGKMLKTEVCLKSHMKLVHGSERKELQMSVVRPVVSQQSTAECPHPQSTHQ